MASEDSAVVALLRAELAEAKRTICQQRDALDTVRETLLSIRRQLSVESCVASPTEFREEVRRRLLEIKKELTPALELTTKTRDADEKEADCTESVERLENCVAILDAGSQFGKVIDRRIRECNVQSELVAFDSDSASLRKYTALVISGGPSSVYASDAPKFDASIFDLDVPILGICYGFQLMALHYGGRIERSDTREDGQFSLRLTGDCALFDGCEDSTRLTALLTHGDSVTDCGPHSLVTAMSPNGIVAAAQWSAKCSSSSSSECSTTAVKVMAAPRFGVQFHPEVDLTPEGPLIFSNFLLKVARCSGDYTIHSRELTAVEYIRKAVGSKIVISLVSGGVDSSVCTALLRLALEPSQIIPIHVDSGFMRHNESALVKEAMADIGVAVRVLKAQDTFLEATTEIKGVTTAKLCETADPEVKRKIIGDMFMKLCDTLIAEELKLDFEDIMLAQGTLRPDLIESASEIANAGKTADVIKTHHNDTELVRRLRADGRVVEPLTDYHKDEVRTLGTDMGLPRHLVWRQPFPGPGLAIRIICAERSYVTDTDTALVEALDRFEDEDIACCLLGFRTVGVQGDGRSYANCVGLSLKKGTEEIPWHKLFALAKRIPHSLHQVNRVIFVHGEAVSGLQQSVTPTLLNKDTVELLRKADDIVNKALLENELMSKLSQVPIVMFPSDFGADGMRSVCIRAFITNDFMTGMPARIPEDIPQQLLLQMFEDILKVDGIVRAAYDLTSKPPGTTEWE